MKSNTLRLISIYFPRKSIMNKQPEAIKVWNECVKKAKADEGKSGMVYGFTHGKVLERARKYYCARGY